MKNVFTSVVNQIKVDFLQELGHNILAEDASLDLLVTAGAMMVSNSDEDAANTYDKLAGVVGSAALDARRIPINAFDDIFIKKAVEVLEDNIREAAAEECKERVCKA
jgi:hypothetical protein